MRTRNKLFRFSRILTVLLTLTLVAVACGSADDATSTPTTAAPDAGSDTTAAPAGIQTDGFDALGDVTLPVLAPEPSTGSQHCQVGGGEPA